MFIATALLYPLVLALLCLGAGALVDVSSGAFLPSALLPAVGAAALIAISQLATYAYPLAPATPYLLLAFALAGLLFGRTRLRVAAEDARRRPWLLLVALLAYTIALAPVLADGRPSFSSYMALADSAVHMLGAAFLLSHGQHYVHLDLRNSFGQYVNDYYNTSYPSGADTLFGASAGLLGLPLIWAFQPFNAFMLAIASGPAWVIARGMRLQRGWAALAALSASVPALVYAYELFGSVKEISSITMILALGALVLLHRSWLAGAGARAVLPFALIVAAGISTLGIAFGVWALASAIALAAPLVARLVRDRRRRREAVALLALALATLALAALSTWTHLSGSLTVAQGIAGTSNPGNLSHPLRAIQLFGVWLGGSYKLEPAGAALAATHVLVFVSLLAAVLGAVALLRRRAYVLAAWFALMLLAWVVVAQSVTTWSAAKTLMLTSPVAVLLAWGAIGAVGSLRSRGLAVGAAALLAIVLAGGEIASDAMQYHVSDLAPTARYDELASLETRFAGEGPTLFADFDEYSMYELRDLDVGGPDFVYPPPAAASAAGGHGRPVALDVLPPSALASYPLIVTRRDPSEARPPAEYGVVWQGLYYQVWRRRRRASVGVAERALSGSPAERCAEVAGLLSRAPAGAAVLTAARSPELVRISLARGTRPRRWGHERKGIVMSSPGEFSASFSLPRGEGWDVWVQGQFMPAVELRIDGRPLASIAGQLDGNSLVPDTVPPQPVLLRAGEHRVELIRRGGDALAPGQGGAAVLDGIFLTPAAGGGDARLVSVPTSAWRSLCSPAYEWVELF